MQKIVFELDSSKDIKVESAPGGQRLILSKENFPIKVKVINSLGQEQKWLIDLKIKRQGNVKLQML